MVLGFVFCSLGPGVLDLYVPILPCDILKCCREGGYFWAGLR